jgi:hypothetical protein
MDDDDAEYMQGSDEVRLLSLWLGCIFSIKTQDYGFNYSDEGTDDAVSVDVENMYYTAKCLYMAFFTTAIPLTQNYSKERRVS